MEQIIYTEKTDGISIDRIRRDAAFSMPRKHLHNEYEIYYLLEGERYYFIDRRTCHVTGGSLVFIDRNQIHQTSQAGPCSHERILISTQVPSQNSCRLQVRCHYRAFSAVILVYLPWIRKNRFGLSACWTMRLRNFMKKRLDLGIWPCQICPGFSFLPKGICQVLLHLPSFPCLPSPNTER